MAGDFNFKALSLNVRGLGKPKKRISIFRWLKQSKSDIIFLQETHTVSKVVNTYKSEWNGPMYCSHGSSNSKGVAILLNKNFDASLVDTIHNSADGRILILELCIQGTNFKLINLYAPNNEGEQKAFYLNVKNLLNKLKITPEDNVLMGGDFNITFNNDLERKGGERKKSKISEIMEEIALDAELHDIWRVKNPNTKRYTWRQKTPPIASRLDYWFISDTLHDFVKNTDIIPSIRSDHSAITLHIHSNPAMTEINGKGYWKLNNSIINDEDYVTGILEEKNKWLEESDQLDARNKWEYLKYKIRQFSIKLSKCKAKERRDKEKDLNLKLQQLQNEIDEITNPEDEKLQEEYEQIKAALEEIDEYKTEGLIIRSKINWFEKGEKSTKYFLGLENSHFKKKHMCKLQSEDGTVTTDNTEILKLQRQFYEELYSSKLETNEKEIDTYLKEIVVPSLSEECKIKMESPFTIDECYDTLKTFKNNKSPGNDGISAEFYKKFWPIFGKYIVDSFNESFEKGELTTSQKQAIITLIDKKKDRSLLKNWRPISLLNVDYKILTKIFSKRLVEILPNIIHSDQTGYIKNRFIGQNIRTIIDTLYYTKEENIPGILIAIDFQKAFDSLEWPFIQAVLKKFNFGENFRKWVSLFYKNVSSCTLNKGVTSGYFNLERGVRQGDPLSPYLFVLCVEILASKIRQDKAIKGINILGEELKVLQYADDTNGILADIKSAKLFLKTIEEFAKFSGLRINKDKSEAMWLGSMRDSKKKPFGISWPNEPMKILGIFISYDSQASYDKNTSEKIKEIKQIIHLWNYRNLTLLGKIQIIKTFLISKLLYYMSLNNLRDETLKAVKQIIFNFICLEWKA